MRVWATIELVSKGRQVMEAFLLGKNAGAPVTGKCRITEALHNNATELLLQEGSDRENSRIESQDLC